MPFDFKAYDQKCNGLTLEELQREWEHYTRLISGAATSTAVSGVAIPLTMGISTIGVAMAAPAIHNARKKREIIERHLNKLNATHHTRKRDVIGSMAVSGTIGVVTLGVGSMGADAIATAGAEHGIQAVVANETAIKIVTHAALDGAGMAAEHAHTDHLKKKDAFKAFKKAGVFKAVKNAKAAEAGYAYEPQTGTYNNQPYAYPYAAGSSSSQALPMPPPPYTAAVSQPTYQQPEYTTNSNGYPQDLKAPVAPSPIPQASQNPAYVAQNAPNHYTYQQQPIPGPYNSTQAQISSPPQTPMAGYPPQIVQTQARESPHQSHPGSVYQPQAPTPTSFPPTPAMSPYSPAAAPSNSFNMSSMAEHLPPPTAYQQQQSQFQSVSSAGLPTPPQDKTQNQSQQYHPSQPPSALNPGSSYPEPPTGYFPSVPAPPQTTPYPPPPGSLPPQAPGNQTAQPPQYDQSPSPYLAPQPTGPCQQAPPSPLPLYPQSTAGNSASPSLPHNYTPPHASYNPQDYAPHAPYNPQDYGVMPQQQQQQPLTASSNYGTTVAPSQGSQVTHNQDYYQAPVPSKPPMNAHVPQYQWSNSTGTYYAQ